MRGPRPCLSSLNEALARPLLSIPSQFPFHLPAPQGGCSSALCFSWALRSLPELLLRCPGVRWVPAGSNGARPLGNAAGARGRASCRRAVPPAGLCSLHAVQHHKGWRHPQQNKDHEAPADPAGEKTRREGGLRSCGPQSPTCCVWRIFTSMFPRISEQQRRPRGAEAAAAGSPSILQRRQGAAASRAPQSSGFARHRHHSEQQGGERGREPQGRAGMDESRSAPPERLLKQQEMILQSTVCP